MKSKENTLVPIHKHQTSKPAAVQLGLQEAQILSVTELLNRALGDVSVLLTKTKKFHWDVVGPQFMTLHKLWDDQYQVLADFQDQLAERVRTLGCFPVGTLAGFLSEAALKEYPGDVPGAQDAVSYLQQDHEQVARTLRESIARCTELADVGSADLLTGMLQEHEKMAWMLRSFLGEPPTKGTEGKPVPQVSSLA
jgi:starvation-inducible DNA-binding protein